MNHPQKRPARPHRLLVAGSALLCCSLSPAQQGSPTTPGGAPPPSAERDAGDHPVVLTPFEVSVSADSGYMASETLSGTRLKTSIADTGVAETILTAEFMSDLAITGLDQAYQLLPNTGDNEADLGVAANNNALFSGITYTSRGFTVTSGQRDFLPTPVAGDTYNTDRFSFTRGPNAILYGLGNPGGISNAISSRARTDRAFATAELTLDSNDGLRTAFGLNTPLIKNKLALRLARLDDTRGTYFHPDENVNRRTYAALRFTPFKQTIIDANFETGSQHRRALARGQTYSDGYSNWLSLPAGSRPAVTTPRSVLSNTTFPNLDQIASGDQIILIAGAAAPVTPLSWARMGRSKVAVPVLNNFIHGVSRDESFPLPFPIESNLMGYADGTQQDFDTFTVNFQQEIARDLSLETTFYRQQTDRFIEYTMGAQFDTLFVDVNQVLPSGAANPNFGRYYYEARGGPGIVFFLKNELAVGRATLSYEFDAAKKLPGRLGRWLGRHRLAGLAERHWSDTNNIINAAFSNLTPEKTTVPRLTGTWNPAPTNSGNYLFYRYYFDPAAGVNYMPSVWNQYPHLATAENIAQLRSLAPAANGVTPGYVNQAPPQIQHLRSTAKLLAMQNYFFKDRLITLFGWREDTRVQQNLALARDPVTLLYPSPFGYSAKNNPTSRTDQSGRTFNRGFVLAATPWLRLFYNKSSSFLPQNPADTDLYDQSIGNATGDGDELGVRLALFQGKLNASVSRWTSNMKRQSTAVIRNQLGQFNFVNAINVLWNEAVNLSRDNKYEDPPYRPSQGFTDYLDQVAEGYEFSLIANPTPRWRISLNASTQTNEQSNLGPVLQSYWAQHTPLWRNFPSRDLNGNGVIDVATAATPNDQRERFLDRNGGVTGFNTIAEMLGAADIGIARIKASTGVSTAAISRWSANLVTNYQFSEGRLKGVGLGGSLGGSAPRTIGYRLTSTGVYDRNRPFEGEQTLRTGLWVSYSRKFDLGRSHKVDWRVQLNLRNVLGDDDLDPIAALDDGTGRPVTIRYRVPEPRTFVLTNSLRF